MKEANIKPQENDIEAENIDSVGTAVKKRRFGTLRAALVAVLAFTLICGVAYPFIATLISRTAFPYESNGSQIVVTLADGSQRVYGSELIGQEFDEPYYLLGRVNKGAPTNISPEGSDHQDNMNARLEYLRKLGYKKDGAPQNLITSSGSGVDPHITPDDAEWQIEYLAKNRYDYGWRLVVDDDGNVTDYIRLKEYEDFRGVRPEDPEYDEEILKDAITGSFKSVKVKEEPVIADDGTKTYCEEAETVFLYFAPTDENVLEYTGNETIYEDYIRGIIDEYTEGRWLWIFGEPKVNVLLVNLALDGLL